ncbi:MAG: winged helix-turn-helix domain-containing protein [Pseudomonadota bacterium]
MKEGPNIATLAALIGDPARANMLMALMAGKALTVTELAAEAGVSVQTASGHLRKMETAGLTVPRKQGRHRYVTLAGHDVAKVSESLMGLAARAGHLRQRTGPTDAALRKARVCYKHLAGEMGTLLFDQMSALDWISVSGDQVQLTDTGQGALVKFGIDVPALQTAKSPLCRSCLDWSERRFHLAGSLGRAVFAEIVNKGWARQQKDSRVVHFCATGEAAFLELLAVPRQG